jgi:hypothetical protein
MLASTAEPVVVNVYGAQESIPPGWESIPGLLKRFTNTGSGIQVCTEPRNNLNKICKAVHS